MKKKWILYLAAIGMAAVIGSGCSSIPNADRTSESGSTAGTVTEAESAEEVSVSEEGSGTEDDGDGSNILIAYFSFPLDDGVDTVTTASRTRYEDGSLGNTNFIARLIQSETGGDLFAVEVEENHYPTDNFESLAEIAREELDEGQRPAMRTELENLEDYDVIFVGYPIWWYDMPVVMYTFFDQYDFSGKTIIPFITHGGSRLSGTVETIAELEPEAQVSDQALTISRNDVEGAASEVADWVASLNLGN